MLRAGDEPKAQRAEEEGLTQERVVAGDRKTCSSCLQLLRMNSCLFLKAGTKGRKIALTEGGKRKAKG